MSSNWIITTRKKYAPLMKFINPSKQKLRTMIPRRNNTRVSGIKAITAPMRRAASRSHAPMKSLIGNRMSCKNNSTMTMGTKMNMQMR